MVAELSGEAQPKQKSDANDNQKFKFLQKVCFFKDEQVTIFHLLHKGNMLKLPKVQHSNEVGCTNDLNYCFIHRMVPHPTSRCFVLNDKIQALIDVGVLTLKLEQKKVIANMVTLNFGTFPKMTA